MEREFYNPKQLYLETNQNKSNYQALPTNNEIKISIEQQRPTNAIEKPTHDLNVWKVSVNVHELNILLC